MALSSRDRISVDLRGLKAALFERAQALGVSPSGLVRTTLADALGRSDALAIASLYERRSTPSGDRVRVSLRMTRAQAVVMFEAARRAGLSPGDYVAGLVDGVAVLVGSSSHVDHLAALIASSAELSTLTRNIHHLTSLLRQSEYRAAQEYRDMLDTLADDVRGHLMLASSVLAGLRPSRHRIDAQKHPAT